MQIIRVQGQHNMSVSMFRNQTIYLKTVESEQAFLFLQKLSSEIGGTIRQQSANGSILNNRIQLDLNAQTFLT